jgi:ribosome-associated protein
MKEIFIRGEFIELQQFLKLAGITHTGGEAKQLIMDSQVKVNNTIEIRRSRKLIKGDIVYVEGLSDMMKVVTNE